VDLTFTDKEEAFRHEARTWLKANVPAKRLRSFDTPDGFEQHREWEKQLFAGGWAVVTWPKMYGGRDCSLIEADLGRGVLRRQRAISLRPTA
jgi:alkylation response protein AidB-like acyl-CoA dehydrogenase